MAFGRKKNKLDSTALYRAGRIIVRTDNFWRQVQLLVLPRPDEELLYDRITAYIPKGVPITALRATSGEMYFTTSTWQAKLASLRIDEVSRTYEFWFSDPKNDTDIQTHLQMNVLATAVEKAFLLTSPYTIVDVRYATSDARDFTIGAKGQANTTAFTVATWVNLGLSAASPALAIKALQAGTNAFRELRDASEIAQINKELSKAGGTGTLLLERYHDTPALPQSLKEEARSLFETPPSPSLEYNAVPNGVQKGVRYCTSCGTANAEDSHFCYACGVPLRK